MVEYAVLLAHNTADNFSILAGDAFSWASRLDWYTIGYIVLGVVLLWIVVRAFKPARF